MNIRDLGANVLAAILSYLDLDSLSSCAQAFEGDLELERCLDSVLFKRVTILATNTKDPNLAWADECLLCALTQLRGVTFKSTYLGSIYAVFMLKELCFMKGYAKYVRELQVSCVDILSLYVFGRKHRKEECTTELVIGRVSSSEELEELKEVCSRQEGLAVEEFSQALKEFTGLKTVQVLCPCLREVVKEATGRGHRILHQRVDSVRPVMTMTLS